MDQEKRDICHRDIAPLLQQAAKLAEDAKINLADVVNAWNQRAQKGASE